MPDDKKTTAPPAAKKTRPMAFWDIEAIPNIFMFGIYYPKCALMSDHPDDPEDWMMFFYLFDGMSMDDALKDRITQHVFRKNRQLDPQTARIRFMDMADEQVNRFMVNWFCVDNRRTFGRDDENQFRVLNPAPHSDLDPDPFFPYMLGYNTTNYDDVMIAYYFNETWGFAPGTGKPSFMPITAATMRSFNDLLFGSFKKDMKCALRDTEKNIYENLLRSGLYLDVASINDKVYKMPLKRIMGMLGMGIFEDGSVKGEKPVTDPDEIANLFAYNASDCIKLQRMFGHRAFKAQFELKKGLMDSYPDIIYKQDKDGNRTVRVNRLRADNTSAKFAQRVLCPDGWLPDSRAVSFEYPKGSGRNILKETRAWAEFHLGKFPEAMRQLNAVFDWYGAIEGCNFDSSEHYEQTYLFDGLDPKKISDIPMPCTAMPYFNADGTPSRTYVNFGIGGIHGAEYDRDKYDADVAAHLERCRGIMAFLSAVCPQAAGFFPAPGTPEEAAFCADTAAAMASAPAGLNDTLKELKPTIILDGQKRKRSEYVTLRKDGSVSIKWPKPVRLFIQDKKTKKWNLDKKYSYTSDGETDHQDFTSYYPVMLMNLQAYVNTALGEDRYVQQFENKGKFGKLMKDKRLSESERDFHAVKREGTKLILNSASGASDTAYDNPIRMNNVIISMRLIGQMFTWRIGQAETLAGYKVTSTNTDGLYAECTEETRPRLRQILEKEAADINVEIEPEAMRLVSKDANNRIEVSLDGKLLSASGGDVACWKGPVPTKALSHPALIDRLMVDYLVKYGVNEPFDLNRAADILQHVKDTLEPFDLLMLYQQIINSSEGSVRYIFAMIDGEVRTFQHNNRIFAIKPEGAHLYMANGWNKGTGHDETADKVLRAYGVDPSQFTNTRVMKISRIEPEQNMFIYNEGLDELDPAVAKGLIDNLDDGYYIDMFQKTYSNWCNVSGHTGDGTDEDDEDGDGDVSEDT